MQIVSIDDVAYYSRLGQNIYRHDGLLALPRGIVIKQKEIEEIKYHGIDYILAYDKRTPIGNEEDISFTLNIIENAYLKTTLWNEKFGEALYEVVHDKVTSNKKVSKLLNDLRMLDSYSFAHCINISMIIVSLLSKENIRSEELYNLAFVSLLHDIGRLNMVELFNKQGKLSDKEFEMLKNHPQESYKLLKKAGLADEEMAFVMETHEKYNGTGYPYRLKGGAIPDLSQLILIADIYNALSSFRPYRDVYNPHAVSKMIEEETGKAFNQRVVNLFRENFEPYKKGVQVELNDGRIAYVKDTRYSKTLPLVQIISEHTGKELESIDLSSREDLRIKRILNI